MRNVYLDVRLELDAYALDQQGSPTAEVVAMSREEAERLCQRHGATLHTDSAPEFLVERGQNKATGQLCVLVASRWACTVPENTPIGAPNS